MATDIPRLQLARTISRIENRHPEVPMLIRDLFPRTGKAHVIGFTGPPGSGKSTLVGEMVGHFRKQGNKVAVVAVDPSSPFSGGAVLGDRIRMQKHFSDPGVYIRSIGTRGKQGGLSHATREVVMVLDAAGFEVILVETAGVGQTELDVLTLAHTVLVLLVPESGDGIQVMKAGLLEIADIFVVNKADRSGSDSLVKELVQMIGLDPKVEGQWAPPVLKTEAVRGVGVPALGEAIQRHLGHLKGGDGWLGRRKAFLAAEIENIMTEKVRYKLTSVLSSKVGQAVLASLISGKSDPYRSAEKILKSKS